MCGNGPVASFKLDEDLLRLYEIADLRVDPDDLPGNGCRDNRLHLHGFEDNQHVIDLDRLANLDRDLGDRAGAGGAADLAFVGHRGGPGQGGGSGARGGRGDSGVSDGGDVGGLSWFRLEDLDLDFVHLAVNRDLEFQSRLLVARAK